MQTSNFEVDDVFKAGLNGEKTIHDQRIWIDLSVHIWERKFKTHVNLIFFHQRIKIFQIQKFYKHKRTIFTWRWKASLLGSRMFEIPFACADDFRTYIGTLIQEKRRNKCSFTCIFYLIAWLVVELLPLPSVIKIENVEKIIKIKTKFTIFCILSHTKMFLAGNFLLHIENAQTREKLFTYKKRKFKMNFGTSKSYAK